MAFFGKRSGVTRRFWLVRSVILSSAAVAAPVWAQTASQITPPSYAPPPVEAQPPIIIPESAATAPPGSEALEVTLTDIVIEGVTSDPELSAELRRQLTGRPVKVAEIFAAARALETRHARAGAILTRVVVPAATCRWRDITAGSHRRLHRAGRHQSTALSCSRSYRTPAGPAAGRAALDDGRD